MSRVLILANEHVRRRMAGPAIRCFEFARALSLHGHAVTLASPFDSDLDAQPFRLARYDESSLLGLAGDHDVTVMQGYVLMRQPELRNAAAHLVVDLYDPFPLENLIQLQRAPVGDREALHGEALRAVNDQALCADMFLCASEKQRDYWLGWLTAMNRVNSWTHAADPGLRQLIDVVPFGVPSEAPVRSGRGCRGVIEGIGPGDTVLLWGGGIYDWFDPVTLIRAVGALTGAHPTLRLVFMSTGHPNPAMPVMEAQVAARQEARALGLEGRHVFFNETWIPYDERVNWLLDADVGVSTHLDHVETRFSFRTRILDYLWCGLPVISTGGDALGEVIDQMGLGRTVPAEDVTALASAIMELVSDPAVRHACAGRAAEYASTLTWERAVSPLARYCDRPQMAADRAVAKDRRIPVHISGVGDLHADATVREAVAVEPPQPEVEAPPRPAAGTLLRMVRSITPVGILESRWGRRMATRVRAGSASRR